MQLHLFDSRPRTNPAPATFGEDSFTFLNRVDQPFWARIRDELEGWFADYPRMHAADLRGRFRDAVPAQHYGAWWELYLYRLASRLGFTIDVHPQLPGTTHRPDFRFARGGVSCLVEATTTWSGVNANPPPSQAEARIMNAINQARSASFYLQLEWVKRGRRIPSASDIVPQIEQWLDSLDPAAVIAETPGNRTTREIAARDWVMRFTVLPRKPQTQDHRGPILGLLPPVSGFTNDVDRLRRTLDRKRLRYRDPNEPLILAVLISSVTVSKTSIEQALLGSEAIEIDPTNLQLGRVVRRKDGFWAPGPPPQNTRISAVLTGENLAPESAARIWPRLWANPWARHPMTWDLPFPTSSLDRDGLVTHHDVEGNPAAELGLPDDWPGPESPFEKAHEY